MTAVIEAVGLTKNYGRVRALAGLDLEVEQGQVHGFLGPNGAGKTTTIRVLLGLLRRSGGRASLWGRDPWADSTELHRRLAYVPGDVTLWPNLTGGEVIDLLGKLRGSLNESRRAELVERFELDTSRKAGTYSKGNRQKVALIAAMAADAELLILDEPTSGLDPLMEGVFRECVAEARDAGRTILLSSHILSEVDQLCDHVSIVRSGRTVESGPLATLRHLGGTLVEAEVSRPVANLDRLPGVSEVTVDGNLVRCTVDSAGLEGLLVALSAAGVTSLRSSPPSLEELFLRYYGDPGASAA
jgi:ABC-2 type transport system ATP-binding protein